MLRGGERCRCLSKRCPPPFSSTLSLVAGSILYALPLPPDQLVALMTAVSFAAGLNVYATVATLGLLGHTRWLVLPASLHLLADWRLIAAALALFVVDFFADKIPGFDVIWNGLHTFIRVPVAALMAFEAAANLSPGQQLVATLAGGLIAFIAHGGKTAARVAVTPSPEPFSNIGLSLCGDALAVFLTWLSTWKPYVAAGIAAVLLVIALVMVRWMWRVMRSPFWRRAEAARR
jgi:hypothetical protein